MFKILKRENELLDSLTNIGLVREINEDSVITLSHPNNNKIKLLAVADGLGGCDKGEVASQYAIEELKNWFIKEINFNSTILVAQHLYKKIIDINNQLFINEYNKSRCATTLTCAIVLKNDTLIANIGDSRAYALINNRLKQLTKDDSLVWSYYEAGALNKDNMRFHIQNPIVTKCLGHAYNTKPRIIQVKNNNYNGLILLTDGVSDCLSDEKINYIVTTSKRSKIASKLINEAVYHKQKNSIPYGIEFNDIKNGKDNATVALYMKYSS